MVMAVLIEAIGWSTVIAIAAKTAYNVSQFAYSLFVGPALGCQIDPRSYGPWVVVTGATDGIGKAYAFKLASFGLNVVLVSRTQRKLDQVADEIRRESGSSVYVKTIAVDFTEGRSIYAKLRQELDGLPIGMLVNNVGMILECGPFALMPGQQGGDRLTDLINCNVNSLVRMTDLVLPGMIQRNRGLILNIGSLLGTGSSPMYTTYGASKAFLDKFSQDLAVELGPKSGVKVLTVLPGLVATSMPGPDMIQPSLIAPTPEAFVDASIKTLGMESRAAPYWVHKILLYIGEVLHFFLPSVSQQLSLRAFSAMAGKKTS